MKQLIAILIAATVSIVHAESLLIEAESFQQHGGWKLDTQFISEMGSPYLLAHGLGSPVDKATTKVTFPATGKYRVFVRTKDWVARWNAPGKPGRFQLIVDGRPVDKTFGTQSAEWFWHNGGTVQINSTQVELKLKDLTGFDGRCDAIYFTTESEPPPNNSTILAKWRRELLGLPETPPVKDGYDLVVVGGGYAGMGASLAAARMGCKVALIQNRPVLGGNGSSEVRVWAMGNIRRGKFPRVGEIIEEFCDRATKSPGTYEEFGDATKEAIIRAEDNIDLYLNHHAYSVRKNGKRIQSVTAFDTRTGQHTEFQGTLFCDSTGHGTIGFLAQADWEIEDKGRMGMSNMWAWDEMEKSTQFPETPWALDLNMKDFPYPRDHHGQWFWESGFDQDALNDAEAIRDHNLRAVFGAFNAMKNRDGADRHKSAILTWVAYIGGPRESRRLMGDVVLTQEDVVSKREFEDGCVPTTWSIDLHYPKKQYAEKFPDNPFISIAVHDRRVDRNYGYPVPYRCFYSRNIENLFMAGRNVSVTHQALGTVRVMKTCGMMGEVVGRASSLCKLYECNPKDVHDRYLGDLLKLLQLPGKARRKTVYDEIEIPDDALKIAGPYGPPTGLDPAGLPGTIADDRGALKTGKWTEGTGLKGYVAYGYQYSSDPDATAVFEATAQKSGMQEVRIAYQPHPNRSKSVPVVVTIGSVRKSLTVDMTTPPDQPNGFFTVARQNIDSGTTISVTLGTAKTGNTHIDAIQIIGIND